VAVERKFLTPIDMTGLEVKKLRLENATSNPTVPSGSESTYKGRVYYNSLTNQLFFYNGTTWVSAGQVSITLTGDLSGTATTNASGEITLNATINADSVALGTDTTGDYVATITGTANEVEVTGSGTESRQVTIGLPDNVTITNNLNVGGNLNVTGTINAVNTTEINIEDNKINLNSTLDASTAPSLDAGVVVNRGSSADTAIIWNETSDLWTLTNDGTNYHSITRKHSATVGDGTNTSFAITHNLGTRDVTVQVYDAATYDTVEVGVTRTSTSVVTVSFEIAPASGAYKVVIVG